VYVPADFVVYAWFILYRDKKVVSVFVHFVRHASSKDSKFKYGSLERSTLDVKAEVVKSI
jgi:hypothetical protein